MKSKLNKKHAISLIVLVVTILVLAILASVIVISLSNGGIIGKATDSVNKHKDSVEKEESLFEKIESLFKGESGSEVTDSELKPLLGKAVTENTKVTDIYGNKIVIPEGFKIVEHNNDTVKYNYTNSSGSGEHIPAVQDGIVIEDATGGTTNGTRFVWVPVGEIKNKDNTTTTISLGESNVATTDITLDLGEKTLAKKIAYKYSYGTSNNLDIKLEKVAATNESLLQALQEQVASLTTAQQNCKTQCENNDARLEALEQIENERNLSAFVLVAEENGGYYISQNQVGISEATMFQPDSVEKAQDMYGEVKDQNSNLVYASDLINESAIAALNSFRNAYSNGCNISDIQGFTTRGYVSDEGESVTITFSQVSSTTSFNTYENKVKLEKLAATNESLLQTLQEQVATLTTNQTICRTLCDSIKTRTNTFTDYIHELEEHFGITSNASETSKFNIDIEEKEVKLEKVESQSLLQALQEQVANLTTAQQNCRTQCDQLRAQIVIDESRSQDLSGVGYRPILYVQ